MALTSVHPQYTEALEDWVKLRDCQQGERAIKLQGTVYLPATSGMELDGMDTATSRGYLAYQAYKKRAVYPPFVDEAIKAMVGVMWHQEPVVKLPKALEPLIERATLDGESLNLLLRRINEAQLTTGRLGLLLDLSDSGLPYIATYEAESITNWDDGARDDPKLQTLNFVLLNESGPERQESFEWEEVKQYRVLILGDADANETRGTYRQGVFRGAEASFSEESLTEPGVRGKPLDEIPFVFINATDLLPMPMKPPLLELANICLAIYRGEADYRQSLFMQGQDTLKVVGGEEGKTYRLGAGGVICPPIDGDADFIGVHSSGLPEQRQALENDRSQAREMAAQLLDTTSRSKESGEALKVRVAAQTATLNQIAITGAAGLQTILRMAAKWIGANPDEVQITPNLEFADDRLTPGELLQLMQAKQAGLPIDDESLYQQVQKAKLSVKDWKDVAKILEAQKQEKLAQMKAAVAAQPGNAGAMNGQS